MPVTMCAQDLKPANAVFTKQGVIKLIDFGLSLDTQGGREAPCSQVWVGMGL